MVTSSYPLSSRKASPMAAKDPTTTATLWSQRLAGATEQIKAGVMAVREAPGAKAAAQVDAWIAGVTNARDKFVRNVSAVTLQSWQDSMITKGIPRVAGGATAAVPKMVAFYNQFLPFVESVAVQVRSMPKGGIENGVQRAVAQIRGNAGFVYNRRAV